MPKRETIFVILFVILFWGLTFAFYPRMQPPIHAQQPTGSVPTVTGTASGAIVALYLDENRPQESVYAGPSSYNYPAIGVILAGQELPAYGYSNDKTWIQIYYPGVPGSVAWVYAPYVQVIKIGSLPIIEAPPTPTPISTAVSDIDPTLIAAFTTPIAATRLPTFTPPAPLLGVTFLEDEQAVNRVPLGLLILGLVFIGGLGILISFLRGR